MVRGPHHSTQVEAALGLQVTTAGPGLRAGHRPYRHTHEPCSTRSRHVEPKTLTAACSLLIPSAHACHVLDPKHPGCQHCPGSQHCLKISRRLNMVNRTLWRSLQELPSVRERSLAVENLKGHRSFRHACGACHGQTFMLSRVCDGLCLAAHRSQDLSFGALSSPANGLAKDGSRLFGMTCK